MDTSCCAPLFQPRGEVVLPEREAGGWGTALGEGCKYSYAAGNRQKEVRRTVAGDEVLGGTVIDLQGCTGERERRRRQRH